MSNKYEATGTLRAILDTQEISDTFRKREFALEIPDGNYSQTVKFQVVNDKTEFLDQFKVGDEVTVHFNLRGREYTRRNDGQTDWWVNLDCWRMEPAGDAAGETFPEDRDAGRPTERSASTDGFEDEDIPF